MKPIRRPVQWYVDARDLQLINNYCDKVKGISRQQFFTLVMQRHIETLKAGGDPLEGIEAEPQRAAS